MFAKRNKYVQIIILAAVVVLVLSVGGRTYSNYSTSKKLSTSLELGQKYLTELKYKEAVIAFKDALTIDANNAVALEEIEKTYKEWSDSLLSAKDYATSLAVLDEARELFPENQDLIDKEVKVYFEWQSDNAAKGQYSEALDIVTEGYNKLGDERLKNLKMLLTPITIRCVISSVTEYVETLLEEKYYDTIGSGLDINYYWHGEGLKLIQPTKFLVADLDEDGMLVPTGDTITVTEGIPGCVPGINKESYYDKTIDVAVLPYIYKGDIEEYNGEEFKFDGHYTDEGKPMYMIIPVALYRILLLSEPEIVGE